MPHWLKIPSVSGPEYILVPIAVSEDGVVLDPQTMAVSTQLVADLGPPVGGGWTLVTEWDVVGETYKAMRLLGPLTAGLYAVWVQIVDNPETIIRMAGVLEVTA